MQDKIEISGLVLKAITKTLAYTQEELSGLMGVAQSNISRVFKGEMVSNDFLDKFLKATGMPLRFVENCELADGGKIVNQFNDGSKSTNTNFGNEIANQTLNITQNDIDAILNLGWEKEILLIQGHIAQMKHNIVVLKMSKCAPPEEIDLTEQEILNKLEDIKTIKNRMTK